jgi:hypothetical protein
MDSMDGEEEPEAEDTKELLGTTYGSVEGQRGHEMGGSGDVMSAFLSQHHTAPHSTTQNHTA